MADIVADLENATDGMSDAQKKATFTTLGFSDKSMGTLSALIGTSDAIKNFEKELRSASGFTDQVAAKQLESMSAQFQLLKSRVQDVGISIGSQLAPTLLKLGDKLLPLIDKAGPALIALFIALTPAIEGILQLLPLLIDLLVPVIEGLGVVIRDVLNPGFEALFGFISNNLPVVATFAGVFGTLAGAVFLYSNAAKIAAAAQVILTAVMATNPLYLVALAVAAVAAGIVYLATQTTFFQDTWKAVTTFVGNAWNDLWENFLKPVFTSIGNAFQSVYDNFIKPIIEAILIYIGLWAALFEWLYTVAIQPILVAIGEAFDALVTEAIDPATQFIDSAFNMVGEAFKWVYENLIQPALDSLGEGFQWVQDNVIAPVSKAIGKTVETVGQTFRDVFQGVSDFVANIFNGLVDIIRVPINAIIDLINKAINSLNSLSVTIPDWVPEVGGRTVGLNIKNIPKLANGGIVMPRPGGVLANLAEAGKPEAVIPLDRLGSMGGSTFNITVNAGMGSNGSEIGKQIVEEILRYERRSGKVFSRA
jgi:phage-related protein